MIKPHLIGRRAHVPQGAVTKTGVIGADEHVAVEREICSARITVAVDLSDTGFVNFCECL